MAVSDPIRDWLAAFPAQDAQTRLAELMRRRGEIDEAIGELRRFLDLAGAPTPIPGQTALPVSNGNGNGHAPRGMDAVEAVMSKRAGVWTRREIAQELARLGWIAEGEVGRRTLGSIMHRMVGRGRVERESHGRYRLPVPANKEALAA
jgi:hypothetical protein